jgi:hypothetical protein
MRSLLALASVLVASHAAAGEKVDPAAAADKLALKGNVLVWHDAVLLADPSETARTLQLATFEGPRKDRVGHAVVMKVVAGKGAFIEVELAGDEGCTWSRLVLPDDLARVRMFVRRADIAPVLVKPFARTFPDGSSITLGVGTPVVATDAGTFVVSLHGDELEVDVPATQVGYAYVPPKSNGVNMTAGATIQVAPKTAATLGERTLSLTAWKAAPVAQRGETAVVALEDRCASAHVVVPSKALLELDEDAVELESNSGGNNAMMNLRDEVFLPRLTPLSIGERQVAVAAKPIFLHAAPTGKHACIVRAIKLQSDFDVLRTDEKLRVCAPAASVARETVRRARAAQR